VVVPVYGCADCLRALTTRLVDTFAELGVPFEIVYVDDRSPDGAWEAIEDLAREDQRITAVRLSRNFGQHVAITAGLEHAAGDWIVVMDCDLQDRPEDIPRLWAPALDAHELVFTRRIQRQQSWLRRVSARMYFRTRNLLLRTNFETEVGSLMLFSRKVANAFVSVRDKDRPHGLLLAWLGFDPVFVDVEHADRHAGHSSYSFSKLAASAVDGLFFQTTILLRWIVYIGLFVAFCGFVLAAVLIGLYLLATPPPGWTSLAVLLLVIGGVTIISLGVSALYVGKIFDQVKDRPLYVVDRAIVGGVELGSSPGEQAERHEAVEA
jgi:dolichol-phosphate mannosyltransferase